MGVMMIDKFFNPVFAPETLAGPRAKPNSIVHGHGYGGALYAIWGSYDIAANVEDGDIFKMCLAPPGFLALGGWLSAADLDTGDEAMDMDLGYAANGAGSETWTAPWGTTYTNAAASAAPSGLANAGVLTGDPITGVVDGNWRALRLPVPLWFAAETVIQVEANVAAAAGGTGNITCCVLGQIWPK